MIIIRENQETEKSMKALKENVKTLKKHGIMTNAQKLNL